MRHDLDDNNVRADESLDLPASSPAQPVPCGWFARKEIGYNNFRANQEGYQI
jgi:hypothetical protein